MIWLLFPLRHEQERRQESKWIPAFAGMTGAGLARPEKPINAFIGRIGIPASRL
ncbi:hypothetical protein GLE_2727 [Lysobacter enzymogenes]|uniref:Uncharacterized protein n=1 Tax=Lysobacter enzymogenes TaxID=69 RepID=A0A0S2DHH9_LYSEN|nr:hypothetical protein GLE_2727 [Lysobacter enzymogenes]